MATHLVACLPRALALMALAALSTATVTLAAGHQAPARVPQVRPAAPAAQALVVPDVRGQAHVFAKVVLEEAGFAWRVSGPVHGYAANVVARQHPGPGTRVVDNGAPTIVLELARNREQAQRGAPENRSPYAGSDVLAADAPAVRGSRVGGEWSR